MSDNGAVELYRKHRPTSFNQVIGQKAAVAALTAMGKEGKVPHALLFTGPSGTGKTTVARILRTKLGCGDDDYKEINSANARGIDDIRKIDSRMRLAAISGPRKCRVWCLDECHQTTSEAQSALLKILEDTPAHVYFMLCTTDPRKLKPTIRTRCTEVKFSPITTKDLEVLIVSVAFAEGKTLLADVTVKIAEVADGSARKALVLLHQVIGLATAEEQLAVVSKADAQATSIDIVRKLCDGRSQWKDLAPIIKACDEDPETIRRAMIGYAQAILLNGKKSSRAFDVLQELCDPLYDSGKPGLTRAIYAILDRPVR